MKKEEVDNVIPLFEGATEARKIKRSALKNWLVRSLSNLFLQMVQGQPSSFFLPALSRSFQD
jgi:hypothetical protein